MKKLNSSIGGPVDWQKESLWTMSVVSYFKKLPFVSALHYNNYSPSWFSPNSEEPFSFSKWYWNRPPLKSALGYFSSTFDSVCSYFQTKIRIYCETNDVCFMSVTFRLHKLDMRKRSVPCIPTFRKCGKSACCDLETWQEDRFFPSQQGIPAEN